MSSPDSSVSRDGLPRYRTAGQSRCAYCLLTAKLYFTGRRWICAGCFREHMGEEPQDA